MRHAWLVAVLTLHCFGYDLMGRIEPPAAVPVFLHGATTPFESSTASGEDGPFPAPQTPSGHVHTRALDSGAWRDAANHRTEPRNGGFERPSLCSAQNHVVLRIDDSRLESDGIRTNGATVSASVLSIPDRAMREYKEAQCCLSRSESTCASTHLRRALEIAPRFGAAWNQLGTIAYQTSRYSDAEANFRTALDADPEAFEPLVNLGGVLLNLGRPREAIGYNQRAVARRPNDALANSQLGLSYFELNDLDLAEKYLNIAVRIDPAHFSHPQLALAEIYIRRGDRSSALRALHGFLDQHPDSPQAAGVRQEIAELSR